MSTVAFVLRVPRSFASFLFQAAVNVVGKIARFMVRQRLEERDTTIVLRYHGKLDRSMRQAMSRGLRGENAVEVEV